ncbi:hypothetical protein BURPS1106B_2309 [Burkholderia pseudomallei 1106b]|uniref:Uncharacterized protein n=1 Tax=Burkholderia pseudomallei (strain 1106a) TaxID=357348 RepID=A3P986_BURP0|nr:hypothetical protein BURPS1106A_A2867 [Burkholderia pseudomallei 1106a]AFR20748.1 hypothetical protein BPC006_II2825 [Burkholderia pseudomallei BPC006]EES20805.1 hypothetical protein BURPS1106B_2309 [Burkholderia pseudomallei 1106b]
MLAHRRPSVQSGAMRGGIRARRRRDSSCVARGFIERCVRLCDA